MSITEKALNLINSIDFNFDERRKVKFGSVNFLGLLYFAIFTCFLNITVVVFIYCSQF